MAARAHAAAAESNRRSRVSVQMKSEINLVNAQRGFALTKGNTVKDVYIDYMSRNDIYNQYGMMAASQAREREIKEEVEAIVPKAVLDQHLEDIDLNERERDTVRTADNNYGYPKKSASKYQQDLSHLDENGL